MKVHFENQDITLYFPTNLEYLLKKYHMSYAALLKAMEIEKSSAIVVEWINGLAVPSLEELVKISLVFQVTLDELITENLTYKK